jgi:parallel beta-helix repeat protein
MEKKQPLLGTVLLIVLLLSLAPTNPTKGASLGVTQENTIIYVDGGNIHGPWDGTIEHPFRYIQDGINASSDNDLIYIFEGTYNETLFITTSITLYGETTTFINGGHRPILITVYAKDVVLENLWLQNSGAHPGNAGLLLYSHHVTVKNCTFYRTRTGILAQNTSFHTIENCTFSHNGFGVSLSKAQNVTITDCTLGHNAEGLYCEDSFNLLLSSSYFHTNGRACIFSACHNVSIIDCNISDNSVNHGGVFIGACSTMVIENSILRHNGIDLQISYSQAIDIHHCTLSYSTHMTFVVDGGSTNITITDCNITDALRYGIYIVDRSMVTLASNNIYHNTLYGLFVHHATCQTKDNYWSSPRGPSLSAYGQGERIHMLLGRIQSYPWRTEPVPDSGTNWTCNKPYWNRTIHHPITRPITFPSEDSDGDGAPDWWEIKWGYDPFVWDDHHHLDPDGDGLNNIEECYTDAYGANPFRKDIFLELDWMTSKDPRHSNKPDDDLIRQAIEAFERHNISLHIDAGQYGGGEEIPYAPNLTCNALINLYWQYFLQNDMNNPRKGIFRYGIICDIGPDVNFPFMGWDHLDSFCVSAEQLSQQYPFIRRGQLIMKASIHHLGHTLGLLADHHGGIDNLGTLYPLSKEWFLYRTYKSSMNYWYKYRTFSYSDGTNGPGDFDDYGHLDFGFFKNTSFSLNG